MFKAGDVVQLKSGGYPMTVDEVSNGFVACYWHNESGGLQTHEFHHGLLDKAESIREVTQRIALGMAGRAGHG